LPFELLIKINIIVFIKAMEDPMKNLFNSFILSRFIFSFFILSVITAGVLTIEAGKSYAQVGCEIAIIKRATPSDGTAFTFIPSGTLNDTPFDLVSGQGDGIAILGGNTADIVEEVPDGWVLEDVVCETNGVVVSDIENGIELFCSPNGGAAECIFFDRAIGGVPTLSQWGMFAAGVGLGLVGVWFVLKRKKAQVI
jgi:hypothetical protein